MPFQSRINRGPSMDKFEIAKKAARLLSLGVQIERVIGSLPKGTVDNYENFSTEYSRVIRAVERAAE